MAVAKRKPDAGQAPQSNDYAAPLEVARGGVRPPTRDPSPMFFYTFHPRGWQVVGDKLLPDLSKAPVQGGINGVEAKLDRAGKLIGWDFSGLRSQLARAGKTAIPHAVDAPEYESYMRQPWPGHYIDRWTTIYPGSSEETRDEEAFNLWRQSLLDRGIIPGPTYDALRHHLSMRLRMVPKMHQYAGASQRVRPDIESEIERLEREIRVIRAYLAKTDAPAAGLASGPEHSASLEI